jgi:hypothetical protein
MLSEQEQRQLADIERQLAIDDPRFAAAMAGWRLPAPRRSLPMAYPIGGFLLLMVITFINNNPILNGALMLLTGAILGYVAINAVIRRRERRLDR